MSKLKFLAVASVFVLGCTMFANTAQAQTSNFNNLSEVAQKEKGNFITDRHCNGHRKGSKF
jgi:hypothetical protein